MQIDIERAFQSAYDKRWLVINVKLKCLPGVGPDDVEQSGSYYRLIVRAVGAQLNIVLWSLAVRRIDPPYAVPVAITVFAIEPFGNVFLAIVDVAQVAERPILMD